MALAVDWLAGLFALAAVVLFQLDLKLAANIVGLVGQVPWILVIYRTRQWGLIPAEAAFIALYAWGLWRCVS